MMEGIQQSDSLKDNHHYIVLETRTIISLLSFTRNHIQSSQLTNELNLWSTVSLEKLRVPRQVKKFLALYGTRRFIAVFTRAGHLSLP